MSSKGGHRTATLAWALGFGGAVACLVTAGLTWAAGLLSAELLLYLTFIAAGLLGALVASREPNNSVGWLMCAASLGAVLLFLPLDYGYAARVVHHDSWPLGGVALWLAAWVWNPVFGLFLPLLVVRFPDGRVPPRWRSVDWLAALGTLFLTAGVVLASPETLVRFQLIPNQAAADRFVASLIDNPLGGLLPAGWPEVIIYAGLAAILLGYLLAAASLIDRYRHARGEERLQLKWFAYAVGIIAAALIYGLAVQISGLVPGADAEIALHLSFFALPLGIGIAILRYRLYDIDLIINKSLVYGGLTAIVAAAYTAGLTLLQRLFISVSGQKSDAAYVLTAFGIVVWFSPFKDWLQGQVDNRIGYRSPSAVLDQFRSDVEAVVSVIDVQRVACRLVDQAVAAFDARGAALYLRSSDAAYPTYSRGNLDGRSGVDVMLRYEDKDLGHLVLGTRRGDITYTEHDRELLQKSADSVGEALALAEHLGFRPLPRSRN